MHDQDLYSSEELHAYVDGQLPAGRRLALEQALAQDPEARQRVEAYRAQTQALHALFDKVLTEPVDERLSGLQRQLAFQLEAPAPWRPLRFRPLPAWAALAAGVALVAVGVGSGWLVRDQAVVRTAAVEPPRTPLAFAEEAAQAHTFYAGSRFEVEMGAEDPDALNNWLSERLGKKVFAPDLGGLGYRLIGGRSLPTDTGVGAQYMYESDAGNRITLFVGAPQGKAPPAFSFVQRGQISSFYWTEGPLTYALVGPFDRDRLLALAQVVHQQLTSGAAVPRPAKPAATPPAERDAAPQPPEDPHPADTNRPKPS
jgi:anti-sigma factor RsiW